MIIKTDNRVNGAASIENGANVHNFYSCLETEPIALSTLLLTPPTAMIHVDVYKWSKEAYITLYEDFQELCNWCKEQSITLLCVFNTKDITKWNKFLTMFGFSELQNYNIGELAGKIAWKEIG